MPKICSTFLWLDRTNILVLFSLSLWASFFVSLFL